MFGHCFGSSTWAICAFLQILLIWLADFRPQDGRGNFHKHVIFLRSTWSSPSLFRFSIDAPYKKSPMLKCGTSPSFPSRRPIFVAAGVSSRLLSGKLPYTPTTKPAADCTKRGRFAYLFGMLFWERFSEEFLF